MKFNALFLLIPVILCSCETTSSSDPSSASAASAGAELSANYVMELPSRDGSSQRTVVVARGLYLPVFQDDEGIYYSMNPGRDTEGIFINYNRSSASVWTTQDGSPPASASVGGGLRQVPSNVWHAKEAPGLIQSIRWVSL